jgi:hypothetical protein
MLVLYPPDVLASNTLDGKSLHDVVEISKNMS